MEIPAACDSVVNPMPRRRQAASVRQSSANPADGGSKAIGSAAILVQAVAEAEGLGQPLELGRALLTLGRIERRAKRKRTSRDALDRAAAIFEALPAPLWAARARDENRTGGHRLKSRRSTLPAFWRWEVSWHAPEPLHDCHHRSRRRIYRPGRLHR